MRRHDSHDLSRNASTGTARRRRRRSRALTRRRVLAGARGRARPVADRDRASMPAPSSRSGLVVTRYALDAARLARRPQAFHHGDRRPACRRSRHDAAAHPARGRHRAMRCNPTSSCCSAISSRGTSSRPSRSPDPLWAAELARLTAPLGTWAILGNHDWWHDLAGVRTRARRRAHSGARKQCRAARRRRASDSGSPASAISSPSARPRPLPRRRRSAGHAGAASTPTIRCYCWSTSRTFSRQFRRASR